MDLRLTVPVSEHPAFLFAPGAGAPSSSEWMVAWAKRLATLGPVRAFDYDYQRQGRKRPDPLARLVERHGHELAVELGAHERVILAGKSMGSRVGCHLALEPGAERVLGLVCFGYPLVGASTNKPVRDAVLLASHKPILFVQGTRDPLCPLDRLAEVRARMTASSELFVVAGGDHSLRVGKRELAARGQAQDDVDVAILAAVATFCAGLSSSGPSGA